MIFEDDLAAINRMLAPLWPRLSGARIFMTGGTGFIGRWMLEALARSGVDAEVTLLSRDPDGFATRVPHLAARFRLVAGDATSFTAPAGDYSHVIHAATDASAALNANDPRRMFETIVQGTRRALDLATDCRARFFFLSAIRELNDHGQYVALTQALVRDFPDSSWSEEALNNLGTHYILTNEDELAAAGTVTADYRQT